MSSSARAALQRHIGWPDQVRKPALPLNQANGAVETAALIVERQPVAKIERRWSIFAIRTRKAFMTAS